MTLGISLALLVLVPGPGLQEPEQNEPPPATSKELLDRYNRLDRDQRNTVVRNMERRLRRVNDDVLQRVAGFERGLASYPTRAKPKFYLTKDYAPVATKRKLIAPGTPAHTRGTRQMKPFLFVPDLHASITYDWQQGKAVRIAEGLDDDDRFANYVNGYAPGADHAIGRILEALDTDSGERQMANYFEHLYADRNGGVYTGVSMFDAWNSGIVVEMPDTDAIAYARDILHTRSFVSPIPPDRRRNRLYQRVREGFAVHREYRTLRLAAAASFVVADPKLDSTYEPLIRRCRWLWIQVDYDVARFAARLTESGDRATFLTDVDRAIEASPEIVDAERALLRARSDYLRGVAQRELDALDG